jgi:hypothetical protein
VCGCVVRRQRQRSTEAFGRTLGAGRIAGDRAEEIPRGSGSRLGGGDLRADLLGLCQSAGLIVAEGGFKRCGRGCHRRYYRNECRYCPV